MLGQSFTDFVFATNTDGSGKAASYVRAFDMLGPTHCPKPIVGGSMWHSFSLADIHAVLTRVPWMLGMLIIDKCHQAKRWKRNVQAPIVQQVRGSLGAHEQGCIVTTSDFSSGAREEARKMDKAPIALIDGKELINLMLEYEVGVRRKEVPLFEVQESLFDGVDEAR